MSTLASLPFASSSPSIAAAQAPRGSLIIEKATLILTELMPHYRAVDALLVAALEAYRERVPPFPETLFWRFTDPVRSNGDIEKNGKFRMICDFDEIERRRNSPPMIWTFIGTEEEFERTRSGDFDGDKYCYPKPDVAHLWEGREDVRQRQRLSELLAAMDSYRAAQNALREELELEQLESELDEFSDEIAALVDQLVMLRASSPEELEAKAAVLTQWLLPCESEHELGGQANELARSIIAYDLGGHFPLRADRKAEMADRPQSI